MHYAYLCADDTHSKELLDQLEVIKNEYFWLGGNLGLRVTQLKSLNDVVSGWLKQEYDVRKYGPPTWSSLIKAVEPIDSEVAENIASKHHKSKCSRSCIKGNRMIIPCSQSDSLLLRVVHMYVVRGI